MAWCLLPLISTILTLSATWTMSLMSLARRTSKLLLTTLLALAATTHRSVSRNCEFYPVGMKGLSLGFQPQVRVKRSGRPERATESLTQMRMLTRRTADHRFLSPLQGESLFGRVPGVK